MSSVVLVLVLFLLLGGGGFYGFRFGSYRPLGVIMVLLIILLIVYVIFGPSAVPRGY